MVRKALTLLAPQGGCAAKVGPSELYAILAGLRTDSFRDNLTSGWVEDAGCIQISSDVYLVQSIDAISPVSDDPIIYGAIAVEHALNDLYVLGATPIAGLLMMGLPALESSVEIAQAVLQGAIDRLSLSGATLMKGHTISNQQLELGVGVTGLLKKAPRAFAACAAGDLLILSKPLGTGIIVTAEKLAHAELPIRGPLSDIVTAAERIMLASNAIVAAVAVEIGVNACTDISGFGLIGHLHRQLLAHKLSAVLNFSAIPLIPGVIELAEQGLIPAGSERNAAYWWDTCEFSSTLSYAQRMPLFDAQTSGGLLITVSRDRSDQFLDALHDRGVHDCAVIGYISEGPECRITIQH